MSIDATKRRAGEHEARRLFEDASSYPGLPVVQDRHHLLRVWVIPAFTPWSAWSLSLVDGRYCVRRVVCRPAESGWDTYGADGVLEASAARDLLHRAAALRFAPWTADEMGTDWMGSFLAGHGTRRGVAGGSKLASARCEWWQDGPPQWAAVVAWHAEATALLDADLPRISVFG